MIVSFKETNNFFFKLGALISSEKFSDVKSFSYDDMLADFDVMYRDLSTEDYRRIAKSLSFNNIKASVETVFFKYTDDNTVAIMNRNISLKEK